MRILIVDDDRMICEGNARRIARMNFKEIEDVQCAYSGEEAISMLKSDRFDALLTDIRMAEMDGLQLIQASREINPHLICIVITAYDRFQYAQQALRLGVEDFLVKPLSEQSMRKHIESVIAKYQKSIAEKDSKLELEICAQVVSGQADIDACFRQCGMNPPSCPICMVVWNENIENDSMPEWNDFWLWKPTNSRFLLVEWKAQETMRRLNALCIRTHRFAGVSMPGKNLKEMSSQAEQALEFTWVAQTPSAACWTEQQTSGFSEMRHRLLVQVRALNSAEIKRILNREFNGIADNKRKNARDLILAVENELADQRASIGMNDVNCLVLKPGLGIQNALKMLSEEISAIRNSETQPDLLNPVVYAKHYAQEHLYEEIDMATLANRLNLSYAYFSRIFREQAGTSFSRYLVSLKMQEACRLLLNGEKLVDIAEKLGYQNPANLTRSFTREIGLSPSRWLEEQL